ncbi:MAG: hypothetical protein WA742_09120 [Candidatus Cybelea sp.]
MIALLLALTVAPTPIPTTPPMKVGDANAVVYLWNAKQSSMPRSRLDVGEQLEGVAALPSPTPISLSVLPLSYDSFCEGKHQGHVAQRVYVAGVGTYVVCDRNPAKAWLFTKVGVPVESTPLPGLPPA